MIIGGYEAVSVEQLIKFLQAVPNPRTTPVLYKCCSDYAPLGLQDIEVLPKGQQTHCFRKGAFMQVEYLGNKKPKDGEYVPVVIFPGN